MYCEKCAKQLPDDALYCLACGKPTGNISREPNDASKATKRRADFGVVVLVVLAIAVLLIFAIPKMAHQSSEPTMEFITTARHHASFVSIPHEQTVFSGSVAVNPHNMYFFIFTVKARMKKVRLSGKFQAVGGTRNDVQAVVCSEEDFVNFRNGHQVPVFYNSGKATVGDIDASLPEGEGKYVLAFSNAFSPLSGKTVNGEAVLHYETGF